MSLALETISEINRLRYTTDAVRDAFLRHVGGVGRCCAEASVLLVLSLRANGLNARTRVGDYLTPEDERYSHAHVLYGRRHIADPTVEQFDPQAPLVCTLPDGLYAQRYLPGNEQWETGQRPPQRPDAERASAYLRMRAEWWGCEGYRDELRAVAADLGLDEVAAAL